MPQYLISVWHDDDYSEADWTAPGALSAAKRLMRQALAVHLGGRPLVSRELFRKP